MDQDLSPAKKIKNEKDIELEISPNPATGENQKTTPTPDISTQIGSKFENPAVIGNSEGTLSLSSNTSADLTSCNTDSQSAEDSEKLKEKYYFVNFWQIYDGVFSNPKNQQLFLPTEFELLNSTFREKVSIYAQRLFIRLFQRKRLAWFKFEELNYSKEEIDNIEQRAKELASFQLCDLIEGPISNNNAEQILMLLSIGELRTLAKQLKITSSGDKEKLLKAISAKKTQKNLFGKSVLLEVLGKQVKLPFIRLAEAPVIFFERVRHLFFLNAHQDQKIFVLSDMKKVSFPKYQIPKEENQVFISRRHFLAYESACHFQEIFDGYHEEFFQKKTATSDLDKLIHSTARYLIGAIHEKTELDLIDPFNPHQNPSLLKLLQNDEALNSFLQDQSYFQPLQQSSICQSTDIWDESLLCFEPPHDPSLAMILEILKSPFCFRAHFTVDFIFYEILCSAVKIYERQKMYATAILLLRIILSLPFNPPKRGKWYERLCINLDHLSKDQKRQINQSKAEEKENQSQNSNSQDSPKESKKPKRRNSQKLEDWEQDMCNYPKKLSGYVCETGLADTHVRAGSKFSLQKRMSRADPAWESYEILKPNEIQITGILLNSDRSRKSLFVGENDQACSVERLALEFFQREHFEGVHSETGIFLFYFCIFFWDEIFMSIPCVFQHPFQNAPLDMATDMFYFNRTTSFETKFQSLSQKSREELTELFEENYLAHLGEECRSVNWRKYDLQTLKDIVLCFEPKPLCELFQLLAQDFKSWSKGLPDLLLYNLEERKIKLVEVKGPRDRLSDIQTVWIHHLLKAGITVEICKVLEDK